MASCRRWPAAAIHPQHVQAVHQQGRGDADDDGRRQRYADGIEQQGGARAGKVKIPRMSRAGRTVASRGARRWVAAAKNPKATRELDTQVR